MGSVYIRQVVRKAKTGDVTYVQIAHNQWDPDKKRSVPTVVANLGRVEESTASQLRGLAHSCLRFLGETPTGGDTPRPEPVGSRPAGGAWVLDQLWRELRLDQAVTGAARKDRGRPKDMTRLERVVFGMVADRALAPSSKLAGAGWMTMDVAIPGMPDQVSDDECYRAMDWLSLAGAGFARRVYDQVADLLNLEVDLVFFDTTSTYWERETADPVAPRDDEGQVCDPGDAASLVGFRTWGKSKDHRPDLPQIVVGMAVTRTGIPVRVWSWPGNTADSELIRQARKDLRDQTLSKVVYVGDRGFTSDDNRRALMSGGDGYILGEKLRSGSAEATAALSRPGRYKRVAGNLEVKEVQIGSTDRFIVCFNPEQVPRDQAARARMVARLESLITASDDLTASQRSELKGRISTMPGPNRFLRVTPAGLLRVDKAKITTEARLDGKYLLRTSDPNMSTEDVALGYKQLLQVERGWRTMKSTLELRPVYHWLEHRIRAHVVLCWLSLLLIRIAETRADQTWDTIRREMQRLSEVTYQTPDGTIRAHTKTTPAQKTILGKLDLPSPAPVTVTPAA